MAAYNERQILSQVQSNSIKSKHGSFCRILRRKILSTKPYFLLQVFLAWKEVCFDRIDKVRKSVQFYLPPSEPPMFKPSQLPTPVSRYQGKVSRKSSVLAWTSRVEPHGHWSKSVFSCSTTVQDELFNEPFSDCMCMFDWAITVCLYLSMKKTASCQAF